MEKLGLQDVVFLAGQIKSNSIFPGHRCLRVERVFRQLIYSAGYKQPYSARTDIPELLQDKRRSYSFEISNVLR